MQRTKTFEVTLQKRAPQIPNLRPKRPYPNSNGVGIFAAVLRFTGPETTSLNHSKISGGYFAFMCREGGQDLSLFLCRHIEVVEGA
jgi:hypothetical protein